MAEDEKKKELKCYDKESGKYYIPTEVPIHVNQSLDSPSLRKSGSGIYFTHFVVFTPQELLEYCNDVAPIVPNSQNLQLFDDIRWLDKNIWSKIPMSYGSVLTGQDSLYVSWIYDVLPKTGQGAFNNMNRYFVLNKELNTLKAQMIHFNTVQRTRMRLTQCLYSVFKDKIDDIYTALNADFPDKPVYCNTASSFDILLHNIIQLKNGIGFRLAFLIRVPVIKFVSLSEDIFEVNTYNAILSKMDILTEVSEIEKDIKNILNSVVSGFDVTCEKLYCPLTSFRMPEFSITIPNLAMSDIDNVTKDLFRIGTLKFDWQNSTKQSGINVFKEFKFTLTAHPKQVFGF